MLRNEERKLDILGELRTMLEEVDNISENLRIPFHDALYLLILRELVILNRQISWVHEHIDRIEKVMKNEGRSV
jgi:flagellin-specific chaperone FliS